MDVENIANQFRDAMQVGMSQVVLPNGWGFSIDPVPGQGGTVLNVRIEPSNIFRGKVLDERKCHKIPWPNGEVNPQLEMLVAEVLTRDLVETFKKDGKTKSPWPFEVGIGGTRYEIGVERGTKGESIVWLGLFGQPRGPFGVPPRAPYMFPYNRGENLDVNIANAVRHFTATMDARSIASQLRDAMQVGESYVELPNGWGLSIDPAPSQGGPVLSVKIEPPITLREQVLDEGKSYRVPWQNGEVNPQLEMLIAEVSIKDLVERFKKCGKIGHREPFSVEIGERWYQAAVWRSDKGESMVQLALHSSSHDPYMFPYNRGKNFDVNIANAIKYFAAD
jgi:hypothetical protein